ncbi:MAG: O-antigen translocase [Chlorobiaceae bacterium]|nr:O-antigen translocase [Chlorobiaceae bacterium]
MSKESSHKQILKSTGIIGGSQVISVLVGILRTKIVAVLLGPAGVGIIGVYQASVEIIQAVTGLGIHFSAIRDVAEAHGTGDEERIGRTFAVLKRWIWITGLLGMVTVLVFSAPLSRQAFGDNDHAIGMAILSLTLLLAAHSGGQQAVLNGFRQIASISKVNIFGVVLGFCISVPLYFFFGKDGIVPALVLNAFAAFCVAWWYAHKISIRKVTVTWKQTFTEGYGMIRLGFFGVVSGFITAGIMFYVRVFISNQSGLEAVGQFQSAWSISSVYLGMVLSTMWSDFFPRLSEVNKDNDAVNRLLNEQTEVVLLLVSPVIIGMITFVPLMISLFYTDKFSSSVQILQWQLMGDFIRILAWPIGFVILAKAKGLMYVISESLWYVFYFLLLYFSWNRFGLEAAGIAFFFAYLIAIGVLLFMADLMSGFRWGKKNVRYIASYFFLVVLAFLNVRFFPVLISYATGSVLVLLAATLSYNGLKKVVDIKQIFRKFIK